jgi:hypothetical protein
VIQVLGRRRAPAPTFAQAAPALRQQMIHAAVQKLVTEARAKVKVETFGMAGMAAPTTSQAAPPASQAKPPASQAAPPASK